MTDLETLIAKLGDCPRTEAYITEWDTFDHKPWETALADAALLELASKLREKTLLLETHEPHGHNVTNEQYVNCLNRAEAERIAERENGRTWHREAVALKDKLAALEAEVERLKILNGNLRSELEDARRGS